MEDLSVYREYKNHIIHYEEMGGFLECFVVDKNCYGCAADKVAVADLSERGSVPEAVKFLFPKAKAFIDLRLESGH